MSMCVAVTFFNFFTSPNTSDCHAHLDYNKTPHTYTHTHVHIATHTPPPTSTATPHRPAAPLLAERFHKTRFKTPTYCVTGDAFYQVLPPGRHYILFPPRSSRRPTRRALKDSPRHRCRPGTRFILMCRILEARDGRALRA